MFTGSLLLPAFLFIVMENMTNHKVLLSTLSTKRTFKRKVTSPHLSLRKNCDNNKLIQKTYLFEAIRGYNKLNIHQVYLF